MTRPFDPPAPVPGSPLWADGRIALRVRGLGAGAARDVTIERPYALVGRIEGADVQINDPAISNRHVYMHLDRRGLFAVDLATRGGAKVGPEGRPSGWLLPGQALEVVGHRIELLDCRVDGATPFGPAAGEPDDPLADAGPIPLVRVALYPTRTPESPMVLGSELVFVGRSPSCGVRAEGESASRIHCVLVRTRSALFVVDLVGRGTWINSRPLRGASPLADGDSLMVGSVRFDVRVEAPWSRGKGEIVPAPSRAALPAEIVPLSSAPPAELLGAGLPPLPPGIASPEAQGAILAWMMGVLQAGQAEILRQQGEFQRTMALMLRQLHQDNSSLLAKHLERVDSINRELTTLREELRRRTGADAAPGHQGPALPPAPPLRIAPTTPTNDPAAATSWLLDRVNQLEQESRSSWKDLLGRISGRPEEKS